MNKYYPDSVVSAARKMATGLVEQGCNSIVLRSAIITAAAELIVIDMLENGERDHEFAMREFEELIHTFLDRHDPQPPEDVEASGQEQAVPA